MKFWKVLRWSAALILIAILVFSWIGSDHKGGETADPDILLRAAPPVN